MDTQIKAQINIYYVNAINYPFGGIEFYISRLDELSKEFIKSYVFKMYSDYLDLGYKTVYICRDLKSIQLKPK